MPTTTVELALSPAYRHAQRVLAAWLEYGNAEARRGAFAARAALAGLDPAERHRVVRWLAWLHIAARSRGTSLQARIQRLDATLCAAVEDMLSRLPPGIGQILGLGDRLIASLPAGMRSA
jgi:hypothetical protein